MTQNDRTVLRLTGSDSQKFLNDLVTNDLGKLSEELIYAALLTPQGKYLFDFFLAQDGDSILLDVDASRAAALFQRLNMYKLRADVGISESGLSVCPRLGDYQKARLQTHVTAR